MKLSDVEDLVRSHLIEGETMTEQPTNYFGDRMYSIITAGAPAYVYTLTEGNLYAIAALDALEAWAPGEATADRTIDIILGYARRNGQPTPPPDPEEVFAGMVSYLRPLLQEGESLSVNGGRDWEATLTISAPASGSTVSWSNGVFCYSSPFEPGYNSYADNEVTAQELAHRALREARIPADRRRPGPAN